jgi:hypothetical protein
MREYFSLDNELVNNRYNLVIENFDMLIGPKGDTGDRGYSGVKGPQGIQGDRGYDGSIGDIGPQGPQGYKGLEGIIGSKGPKGKDGEKGPVGFQGFRGEKGLMGDQGSKGEKGEPGVQGYDGRQGYMGFMGDRGLMGNTILTDVLIEEDGQTQALEMNGFLNEASIESSLQSKMISPLDGKEIMLQGKNTTSVSALCPYNGYLNSLKFTTHNLSLNRTSSSSKIRENQDGIDVNISNLFSEAGMPYKFKAGCKKMVNDFND